MGSTNSPTVSAPLDGNHAGRDHRSRPSDELRIKDHFYHMEPCRQGLPIAQSSPEDYTDAVLETRQMWAKYTCECNPTRTPNSWRFVSCYAYYLAQARKESSIEHETVSETQSQTKRLQACRQLMLFETKDHSETHPCDIPYTNHGQNIWICTTVLLRYTLYTRYRSYIARKLETFDFVLNARAKAVWEETYNDIVLHEMETNGVQVNSDTGYQASSSIIPISDILLQLDECLGLRPTTIKNAVKSLMTCSRHLVGSQLPTQSEFPAVSTYEVRNWVRDGKYQILAHTLYGDFVALDTLMRFEVGDLDIVHLQAVVKTLIRLCFGITCYPGQHELNTGTWRPTFILKLQTDLLQIENTEICDNFQWTMQIEAERAEMEFSIGWAALCRDKDEQVHEVQELLGRYLATLGIEDANEIDYCNEDESGYQESIPSDWSETTTVDSKHQQIEDWVMVWG